jgi:integrase
VGRKSTNNPRQMPSMRCGCKRCTDKYRPGEKHTRKDCTGAWHPRYTDPGGRERAENFPDKDRADKFLIKIRAQVQDRTWIDPVRSGVTLAQWHEKWWPVQRGEDATLDRDERMWRIHVKTRFGTWPLADIGYLDIQAWVNELEGPLEPGSITKAFQVLDRMLAAALRDRRIPFNPAEGVKLPKARKKHPEDARPPSYAQLWRVRACLPEYHHALQIVAQETGLRWGELAGLRACWVDLDNGRIQVREVLTEVRGTLGRKEYPKSDAGQRTVPLTGLAARVLRDHMAATSPSSKRSTAADGMCPEELVFHGRNEKRGGKPHRAPLRRSAFRRLWVKAIQDAGIARVTVKKLPGGEERKNYWPDFHDQRHTFASKLHARGVPEVITQEILGHERAGSVTWLYTHAAADVAGQVLAALGDTKPGGRPRLRAVA